MMFEIDDIATVGSVRDIPGYMLPPQVWTLALNMRYLDDALIGMNGWESIFGTPIIPPHFALPLATEDKTFWLYVSLTNGAVFDGTNHFDTTRASGVYGANDTKDWNGTVFGGIPILNNGADIPQYWAAPNPSTTKFDNLPNWPATKRAKVIRSFGPFLVAASITESSVNFPHRVLWSHPAAPGAVPPSWDVANPAVDAGEIDLPDVSSGVIVDALPLGQTMFIYKEAAIWKMRFVGGQGIFDFGQSSWITTAGLLGPRCVCLTGDGTKHILATQDDIIWHNGSNVQSILNKRQRRRLQNDMDGDNFSNSFIFPNPFNNEVWFCYPSVGFQYPNRALVMNYKAAGGNDFVVTEADGITFRNSAVGSIESFVPITWDTVVDSWHSTLEPWSRLERRRVIVLSPTGNKFFKLDSTDTRDGVVFARTLQREGIALIGKKPNGDPVVDFETMKLLKRLWPKIIGTPVSIRFGAQQLVNGATLWGTQVNFDPNAQVYVDPGFVSGRAVGFEITGNSVWRLDGYKLDMEPMGKY